MLCLNVIHHPRASSCPFWHSWPLVTLTHSHTLTQTHTHSHTDDTLDALSFWCRHGFTLSIHYLSHRLAYNYGSEYIGPIAAAMRSEAQLYRYSLPCVRPASRSFCLFGRLGGLCWFCLWSTCGVRLIDTPRNLISYRHYSLSRAAFADAAEFKSCFIYLFARSAKSVLHACNMLTWYLVSNILAEGPGLACYCIFDRPSVLGSESASIRCEKNAAKRKISICIFQRRAGDLHTITE